MRVAIVVLDDSERIVHAEDLTDDTLTLDEAKAFVTAAEAYIPEGEEPDEELE